MIISAGNCGTEQAHLRNPLQGARYECTRERESDEVRGTSENRQPQRGGHVRSQSHREAPRHI